MDRSVDFWKTKWENVKKLSRKRAQLLKKQNVTGGGKLTKTELKVVESQQYSDLASKLGISAQGSDARLDSDATNAVVAPTNRHINSNNFTPIRFYFLYY